MTLPYVVARWNGDNLRATTQGRPYGRASIRNCRECIYAFRKKSHNGTDKSVPYGRALPLIQGLTKLFCEFAKRTRALPDKQFVCRSAEKANASIHAPPRRAGSRKADFWHSQKCWPVYASSHFRCKADDFLSPTNHNLSRKKQSISVFLNKYALYFNYY